MQITVGPLYYYWPQQALVELYAELMAQPVDRVYLGEVVCSKRRSMRLGDWMALARDIQACGKEVVLSSLTLMEAESEVSTLKRVVDNGEFLVECNDMAAVHFAVERKLPFVTGPSMNLYNARALAVLAGQGLQRWVPPVELSRERVGEILEQARARGLGMETEIFARGRLPLAWSARCFTARHYNLPKDQCANWCLRHPEGIPLQTLDGEHVFQLNGIQTLSSRPCNLIPAWRDMRALGADALRVSLDRLEDAQHIRAIRDTLDECSPRLEVLECDSANGYWYGTAGMDPGG